MATSLDSSTTQKRKPLPPELQAPDPETAFATNATAGKPALPPSLMPPDLPPELQPPDPPRQRQVPFQGQAQDASPEHPSYWSRIKDIPGDIVAVFEQGLDDSADSNANARPGIRRRPARRRIRWPQRAPRRGV